MVIATDLLLVFTFSTLATTYFILMCIIIGWFPSPRVMTWSAVSVWLTAILGFLGLFYWCGLKI